MMTSDQSGKWGYLQQVTAAAAFMACALAATPGQAADRLGVTLPTVNGPWYTNILYGITDEAQKHDYEVTILDAGGYSNVDKQISQMQTLIVQKVKAILLDAADPAAFNGVVRQAKAAKIPVIASGSPKVASNVEPDAAASSSHCSIGHEMGKGAKKLLPNGGTLAILAGPPAGFWATERLRCFKEEIAGSQIKIVAEKTSDQDVATALTLANDFLQRFPNVDMLYGADDTYGVGAARAVQGAQKCGKTKVLFAVLGVEAEELMRAGCVDYVIAQQVVLIGRKAVQQADRLIKGQPLEMKLDEVALVEVNKGNIDKLDKSTIQAPKGWSPKL
jgi:ABC-type sugar transport system substrate-binding protein